MCFVPKFIFKMCFKLGHWVLQLFRNENICMLFERKTLEPSYICERQRFIIMSWSLVIPTGGREKEKSTEIGNLGKVASGWNTEMTLVFTSGQLLSASPLQIRNRYVMIMFCFSNDL